MSSGRLRIGDPVPATPSMVYSLTVRQREMLWAIWERTRRWLRDRQPGEPHYDDGGAGLPLTHIDYPWFDGKHEPTGRDKLTLRTLVDKGLVTVDDWHARTTDDGRARAVGLR